MNPEAYRTMAAQEDTHWWYVGRRQIISRMLSTLALPPQARLLEVGSGTGGNLALLLQHGSVTAIEDNPEALAIARARHPGIRIENGRLPGPLPSMPEGFDLICLLDVLEHIAEDQTALTGLLPLLAPGGRVLVTVPAYQWLFGAHDTHHHHFRRYNARQLQHIAQSAGFEVTHASYFNSFLFPVAAIARSMERANLISGGSGSTPPPPLMNGLLARILASESRFVARPGLPFGLSLLNVLQAISHATS